LKYFALATTKGFSSWLLGILPYAKCSYIDPCHVCMYVGCSTCI